MQEEEHPYAPIDPSNLSAVVIQAKSLLIRRYPPKTETEGGLVLPERAQKERAVAWVVKGEAKVGGKAPEPGDTIVCPMHALERLPEVGDDFYMIRAEDVSILYPQPKEFE